MVNKPPTFGHPLSNPQRVVQSLTNCEQQYLKVAMEMSGAGLSLASPICLLAQLSQESERK